MTTTGGPDRSVTDLVRSEAVDDVVVLPDDDGIEILDDVRIEVEGGAAHPRRRTRELIVAGVAILVIVGGAVAFAVAHTASGSPHRSAVQAIAPASPAAAHAPSARPHHATKPAAPAHPVSTPTAPTNAAGPSIVSPASAPPATPASAATPPPASAPVITAPPAEPPSVLRWSATSATAKSGGRLTFAVTVVNPTNGTVTIGQPLSCAPALRGPNGATFGATMCEQIAQQLSPHQQVTQHYSLYATDTGDASGTPLKAGAYTANVEHLFTVPVTIKPAS